MTFFWKVTKKERAKNQTTTDLQDITGVIRVDGDKVASGRIEFYNVSPEDADMVVVGNEYEGDMD